MLVLLVIFIITAPLLVSAVKVDLPKASAAVALDAPKFVAVTIDKAGAVYVDDQPLAGAALDERLAKAAALNPETEVQLRADTAVPYGRLVEVMSAAQKAGLNRIGFVAQSGAAKP